MTKTVKEKSLRYVPGVGWEIAVFFFALFAFTVIWATFDVEAYPNLQSFQATNFPSGVFDVNQLAFMNQLVFWFPVCVLWSAALWLWNASQKKRNPSDLPG
jgi:hypothetical protein